MTSDFATVADIITLARPLTADEQARAAALIPIVCNQLRVYADNVGKDLDAMIAENEELASVAKSVVVDVVVRNLATPTNDVPMSQMSQSALGYTVSGTYLVAGGGVYIKKSEYDRLGLRRQRMGRIDLCG